MHREWVDRRAEGSGRLHDWDPRLKVLLTLVTLLWISFGCTEPTEKSAARLVAIGAATIALAMRGGIPLRGLFLRSLVIVPFVGFIAVARARLWPGRWSRRMKSR